MRINDLLIESTNQLDEGPKFNKFGQAIGNVAGMAAKGIGAVAGGIAGLGAAAKKGFQAGKSQVAATDDGAVPAGKPAAGGAVPAGKPAAGGGTATKPKGFIAGVKAGQSQGLSALNDPNVVGSTTPSADDEDPEAAPAAGATTPPSATDINKAGPKGTAQAKPIQGTVAKQAAAKTGAALAGQDQAQAGQTMYTQVKANIDKLDKKGKQRILQLLQKSMAAPAGKPAAGGAPTNTMANAPVSKTNTAKPGNPNAAPAAGGAAPSAEPAAGQSAPKKTGGKVAGQVSMTPSAVAKRAKRTAAASANSAGAGAFGQMAKQAQTAGKINTGSLVLEGFSIFRKK